MWSPVGLRDRLTCLQPLSSMKADAAHDMSAELAVHVHKHIPVQPLGLATFLGSSESPSDQAVPITAFDQSGPLIATLPVANVVLNGTSNPSTRTSRMAAAKSVLVDLQVGTHRIRTARPGRVLDCEGASLNLGKWSGIPSDSLRI